MLSQLSLLCKGDHAHQPLLAGRAAEAAFYPLGLYNAILKGMRLTSDAMSNTRDLHDEE